MRFFQVNQQFKNRREYRHGYLCTPVGDQHGGALMRELRAGDLLFHHSSIEKMVFAVSRVVEAKRPKDFPGLRVFRFEWKALEGGMLLEFRGRHLSWEDMSEPQRKRYNSQEWFWEAHTEALVTKRLGDSFRPGEQTYLAELKQSEALDRLERHGIIEMLEGKVAKDVE
jgi:hypothetical protein